MAQRTGLRLVVGAVHLAFFGLWGHVALLLDEQVRGAPGAPAVAATAAAPGAPAATRAVHPSVPPAAPPAAKAGQLGMRAT
ncbi:MAG: hypothetical protein KIT17_17565 [Rubrivivax sp.]|nr:hypothetical protein [Rubrivivax sp.]